MFTFYLSLSFFSSSHPGGGAHSILRLMLSIPNASQEGGGGRPGSKGGNEVTFMHFVVILVSCLDWLKPSESSD